MMHNPQAIGPVEARIRADAIARRKRLYRGRPGQDRPAAAPPLDPSVYVKSWCKQNGVDPHKVFDSNNRSTAVVAIRDRVIADLRSTYPRLSTRKIGSLVGLEQKTVRASIARIKTNRRPRSAESRERIMTLINMGYRQSDVAKMLGCSASAVCKALAQSRGGRTSRRMISDYVARIEALFDEGMSLAAISERFDFTPSAVSKLVNKMGWKRG